MASKTVSVLPPFLAGTCILLLAPVTAHADVKIVQSTVVSNPTYAAEKQTMTSKEIAAIKSHGEGFLLGIPQATTTYATAKLFRVDAGPETILVNSQAATFTTIDRSKRVYETTPLSDLPTQGGGYDVTVTPTGKHATICGEQTTLYEIKATNISLPGQLITGDVWTANLAHPALPAAGPLTAASAVLRQVRGVPLKVALQITGTSVGNMSVTVKTLSLSTSPLSASVFKIPKGYKAGSVVQGALPQSGISPL